MTIEEKNIIVENYIINLAHHLNNQYNNIVSQKQIDEAISMYKNSNKDLQEIKEEIDELANRLIENYFKAKNNLNKIGNEIVKKHKEKDNIKISTTPSITDLRREKKRRKKEKIFKMSDIERNMHSAIIQRQRMMKQKENKKEKTKVKEYKTSDNKGFIDVMFGSIISIIIGLIIFSIIK